MAKKNNKKVLVRLQSTESSYYYTAKKTKKLQQEGTKIKLKKYDPIVKKHVLFEEKKLK